MSQPDFLTSLSGVVSHVERRSETSGHIYDGYGKIRTRPIDTRFRVDGRPATVSGSPVLSSGDRVKLIGGYINGIFYVQVLQNYTAGLVYGGVSQKDTLSVYIGGIVCFALAGLFSFVVFMLLVEALYSHNLSVLFNSTTFAMAGMAVAVAFVGVKLIKDKQQQNRSIRRHLG